jgi:peroxiredoxin
MDEFSEVKPKPEQSNGRSPFLFLGGAVLLGLALALLLFGSGWFGAGAERETAVLSQLPAPDGSARVAELPASSPAFLEVGDVAHNFYLSDLAGNIVDLESLRGRPVVINFWATWCAPCRVEMPALQAAYEAHQEDGLVILAVNSGESYQLVSDFFTEFGLTFTPLLDSEGTITRLYNIFNFPSTYFVDEDGVITAVHRGALNLEQIETYLNAQ